MAQQASNNSIDDRLVETLRASLDVSLQRQARERDEQTHQHNLQLLGTDLERLLVAVNSDIDGITAKVDHEVCSLQEYNDFIDRLHTTRMTLLRTHAQWEKMSGQSVEEGVRSSIAALELASVKLINNIKKRIPESLDENRENLPASSGNESTYATRLVATTPRIPTKKRSSKTSHKSKASTSSSTVLKLKLKTEAAAAEVEEQFNKELDERSQRRANREANRELADLEEKTQREKQRLEEEAFERAESLRRKKASIQAQILAIETFDDEMSSESASASLGGSEATGADKAQAYVSSLDNEESGGNDESDLLGVTLPISNNCDNICNTSACVASASFEASTVDLPLTAPGFRSPVVTSRNDPLFIPWTRVRTLVPTFASTSRNSTQSLSTCNTSRNAKPLLPTYTTPIVTTYSAWASDYPQVSFSKAPITTATEFERSSVPPARPESNYSNIYDVSQSFKNSTPNEDKVKFSPERTKVRSRIGDNYKPFNVSGQFEDNFRAPPGMVTSKDCATGNNSNVPNQFSAQLGGSLDNSERRSENRIDNSSQQNTDRMIEAMCGQMALSRLPVSQPDVFDGRDPLSFPVWRVAFDALVDHGMMSSTDKLNLLNQYLSGEAKAAIKGYLMLSPAEAFEESYKLLQQRYGDKFKIASAFRDELRTWPRISGTDSMALRRFVDFLRQCRTAKSGLKQLKILDDESENAELIKKLPTWLTRKWMRRVATYRAEHEDFPSFSEFVDFLSVEEQIANDPLARTMRKTETSRDQNRGGSFAAESHAIPSRGSSFGACAFCRDRHSVNICKKFGNETFEFRQQFVKDNKLCFGCLGGGHLARDCRSRKPCDICQNRHPTIMHVERPRTASPTISVTTCASNNQLDNAPMKSSMIVPVFISHNGNPSNEKLIYAMLDTQSDSSFVTEGTAKSLGLDGREIQLSLSTMTSSDKIIRCNRFEGLAVRGYNSQRRINLPEVYSRKMIPINRDHIPCEEMITGWTYLEPLRSELVPRMDIEVGVLIGYNCPKALVPKDVITTEDAEDGPFGLKTELGWGIVGVISRLPHLTTDHVGYSHRIAARQATGSQLALPNRTKEVVSPADCLRVLERDFLDNNQNNECNSLNERKFLKLMEEEIRVDSSDHYSMPLPFNDSKSKLFNNKALVMGRTKSLKRKLNKDPSYRIEYTKFMEDMVEKGFAEEVPGFSEEPTDNVWYLPHFGIYHKTKGKLRVVFDCAAKYEGISLNDTLLKGPDFINSLVGIICRFRKHPIAFCCDIEKMFYAFLVHSEDRDHLRYLWWKGGNTEQPLTTFRMTAHLFGAVSSPACASFGLRRIAKEFTEYGDDVLNFISRDFYVDDGLKSVRNEEEAISLVKRTVELCRIRGVRLHKFTSNSKRLLKSLPETECTPQNNLLNLDLEEYPTERVLGILWNVKLDAFQFKVNPHSKPETRRSLLSVTSGIFDPLGWISPFTLRARMILQQLCKGGSDWDEKVSQSLLDKWDAWYGEAEVLTNLIIPRCLRDAGCKEPVTVQLHHFSDASENAFGACSYLRTVDDMGRVSVRLVMAKSKVAPIASVTIPRLELMAAVLAARLSVTLKTELDFEKIDQYFWTDSTIVLGYLRNESKRFKIFVANRIQEIQDVSQPSQWNHIPGPSNPADLASRGVGAERLISSSLWFHGPPFLGQKNLVIEEPKPVVIKPDDQELRRIICNAVSTVDVLDIFSFSLFSSWRVLRRAVARAKYLAKKFKDSLSIKNRPRSSDINNSVLEPLNVSNLQIADQLIFRAVQHSYFSEEINMLLSKEDIPKSSPLYRLNCFIDDTGLLRVGGRLRFTNLYSCYKHPIILPKGAHVSSLVIRDCHQTTKHQGRGMTINEVRSRGYWVVGLNNQVKKLIQDCVICKAIRGITVVQKMADLPPDRAECAPPFSYCGVDIFGPFLVKERRSEIKRYGAIFTCLSSRSVHIEMVYSMTTDSFILSLRKFMAIRGPLRLLRCDNGTNFVGANKELSGAIKAIQCGTLRKFLSDNDCDLEFRMNPPAASHMGGAWERLIRVVRSVLSGILEQHSTRLDDSCLSTFLYEVAAIINTRPLSLEHITDPQHPEPLTPNHLLTGKTKVILPPPGEFSQGDMYSVKRWRSVQFLANQFWDRWCKEYLQYLQLRSKWQRERRELRVGDLVLLTDSGAPRNDWRRGIVAEVFVSKDGFVRSVRLRMGKREDSTDSVLVRPVHKLVLLLPSEELADDNASG